MMGPSPPWPAPGAKGAFARDERGQSREDLFHFRQGVEGRKIEGDEALDANDEFGLTPEDRLRDGNERACSAAQIEEAGVPIAPAERLGEIDALLFEDRASTMEDLAGIAARRWVVSY